MSRSRRVKVEDLTVKFDNGEITENISSAPDGAAGTQERQSSAPTAREGKRRKRILLISVIFICFFVLLFCGIITAGLAVSRSSVNLPNIYIGDVFVGGMTQEETKAVLDKAGWAEMAKQELTVRLPADISFRLNAAEAGAVLTEEKAIAAAYSPGHTGSPFDCLFRYLRNLLIAEDAAEGAAVLDEEYIRANMDRGAELLTKATEVSSYRVDEKNSCLVMTKGGGEIKLDMEKLYSDIVSALTAGSPELKFDTLAAELKAPDFDAIHKELAVEPVNAEYDAFFEVTPEVPGCEFDVSEAKKLWEKAAPGQKLLIPLQITKPEITKEMLLSRLYCDRLGAQSTSYAWSTEDRINNIKLAASKINGFILLPGEVFSYNETVGQRTEEAGFRTAHAYSDGKVVDALGGGICQVSSTLYCSAMYAQMKTVSRTNHYFKVDYLDYGLDATVSWTSPDFKFKNTRDYPVKITAWCDDETSTLTIELWGTDTDGSYVTLRRSSEEVYDEKYTDVLIGYTVTTYRDIYSADGGYLNTIAEPGGVYYFHEEDIEWPEDYEGTDVYLRQLEEYELNLT